MSTVPATYYDGQQARPHKVVLELRDGHAHVTGDGIERSARIDTLEITDSIGATPRLLRFPDGAFCEITSDALLARLLEEQGVASGTVSQWEASPWRWALASALVLGFLILGYHYGLPFFARVVADRMPLPVTDRLSTETLKTLDWQVFAPSDIPPSRQADLAAQFDRLRRPGGSTGEQYRVQFRKSDLFGANAMALPSGIIIVTDALVGLAHDDREILGVLAHEAGHVRRRHGLRLVIQGSAVAMVIAWFLGDVSSLVAAAPTAMLQAKYSRDLEREADDDALETMRANDIAPAHLAAMLERLDVEVSKKGGDVFSYLSSHPATQERLDRLRAR